MIWIVGGTKDSRILVEKLANFTTDIVVSITTPYGKKLASEHDVMILDKRLNFEEKKEFIKKYKIDMIIDTSHPYAQNISHTMMGMAKECDIEYLRFERPSLDYEGAKTFEDIESLVEYINLTCKEGNILSTLGSNNLVDLKQVQEIQRLVIRILPVMVSLEKAESLGYMAKNIIGMQGPFSKAFNKAMIENYNIKYLLTKESGAEGGEMEKVMAARECGVKLLVLKRPKISYTKVVDSIEKVVDFVKKTESY